MQARPRTASAASGSATWVSSHGVPYPNFEGKHQHAALTEPAAFVRYWIEHGVLPAQYVAPHGVVMLYQRSVFDAVICSDNVSPFAPRGRRHTAFLDLHVLDDTDQTVGVIGGFGIGAPAAVSALESLAAIGVREFIGIGTAGALQGGLDTGEVVVCDRAVRDEGVSHHYLPAAMWAEPSATLTARLHHRSSERVSSRGLAARGRSTRRSGRPSSRPSTTPATAWRLSRWRPPRCSRSAGPAAWMLPRRSPSVTHWRTVSGSRSSAIPDSPSVSPAWFPPPSQRSLQRAENRRSTSASVLRSIVWSVAATASRMLSSRMAGRLGRSTGCRSAGGCRRRRWRPRALRVRRRGR